MSVYFVCVLFVPKLSVGESGVFYFVSAVLQYPVACWHVFHQRSFCRAQSRIPINLGRAFY